MKRKYLQSVYILCNIKNESEGEDKMKDEITAEREIALRVNISIKPSILDRMDKMAAELNITRSAFIEHLVLFTDAESPRDLAPLLKTLIAGLRSELRGALTSRMKKA